MASLTPYQGHQEKSQASVGKIITIFKQTKNRQTAFLKVWKIPLNGAFNAIHCPILLGPCPILGYFSNWGPQVALGPGQAAPATPHPLSGPAAHITCPPRQRISKNHNIQKTVILFKNYNNTKYLC